MADLGAFAKSTRITGASRATVQDELRARYSKGASIRALAREMGRSYGFAHNILAESGARFRGRGGCAPRRTA